MDSSNISQGQGFEVPRYGVRRFKRKFDDMFASSEGAGYRYQKYINGARAEMIDLIRGGQRKDS